MDYGVMNPTLRETADRLPCLSTNADWWFDESPRALHQAQSLCRTCPVMEQCLAGARERREPHGVWGGEIFSNGRVVGHKRARGRPPRNV